MTPADRGKRSVIFAQSLSVVLLVAGSYLACSQVALAEDAIRRPNVLFIAVDDLNDWIGALGGHPAAQTPHIDRLFSQSLCFANAHCNAPVCAASRNSLLSGLRPSTTGWYTNTPHISTTYRQVLGDVPPLPQLFRSNGYCTLAGGKIYHKGVADFAREELWDESKPRYRWPQEFIDRGHGYGGKHFYPFPRDGGQIYQHYGRQVHGQSLCWGALDASDIPGGTMPDEELADWAAAQLQRDFDKPFFLAVGFRRPHVPYTAPKKYFQRYDLSSLGVPAVPNDEMQDVPLYGKAMALGMLPGGDHQNVLSIGAGYWRELVWAYLACVSFVDDQVGKVLNALEDSPHADHTIVVFWSDHGQNLGEKRHWRKQCLWEESTRVPLAFRMPEGRAAGQRCSRPVSLIDLYPTLVELCQLPSVKGLDGTSLVPLVEDPATQWRRPAVTTWHYRNHSVRSEHWRYTVYRDGTEELFDHRTDPEEHLNLAGDAQYLDIIASHRRSIPTSNALPAGSEAWLGDSFEGTIQAWSAVGGPPEWLRQ
jgi:arylsulfatase A-like enzyme